MRLYTKKESTFFGQKRPKTIVPSSNTGPIDGLDHHLSKQLKNFMLRRPNLTDISNRRRAATSSLKISLRNAKVSSKYFRGVLVIWRIMYRAVEERRSRRRLKRLLKTYERL